MMEFGKNWMARRTGGDWATGDTLDDGAWTRLDGEEDWKRLGKWGDLG